MDEEPTSQDKPPVADADWFAELADSAIATPGPLAPSETDPRRADGTVLYLAPLERERPERQALIGRRSIVTVGIVVAALVVALAAFFLIASARSVAVPDVTGMTLTEAETQLSAAGLSVEVTERRFSAEPEDTVLAQLPLAGQEASKGEVVMLVVSAGSEDFPMPDVIGAPVTVAQETLESKGLIVVLEAIVSEADIDTVLASTPAPGAQVRTGDRVVLQVAASTAPGVTLQPYSLAGVAITLDPAPPSDGLDDIQLEIARRLRALLEASGATVTILRTSSDTETTEASRAELATAATSTVAVGFDLTPAPQVGRVIQSPSQASAQVLSASALLSSAIASELVSVAPPVTSDTTPIDPVLSAAGVPWIRVLLGSATAREDQELFKDPSWADKVARAVYTGLGKSYGVILQP